MEWILGHRRVNADIPGMLSHRKSAFRWCMYPVRSEDQASDIKQDFAAVPATTYPHVLVGDSVSCQP